MSLPMPPYGGRLDAAVATSIARHRVQPPQQLAEELLLLGRGRVLASSAAAAAPTRTLSGFMPRSTRCSATKLRISRPAPDEQHQRQRDLDDHERAAEPAAAESSAHALAGILQRLDDVAPRRLQGRQQPEQEDGQRGDAQAERQDRHVQSNDRFSRDEAVGNQPDEPLYPDVREQTAEQHAAGREDQALDEQLANQPRSAGAHRRADGHLLPRDAALASSMFATLLQAISSSSPTAAASV